MVSVLPSAYKFWWQCCSDGSISGLCYRAHWAVELCTVQRGQIECGHWLPLARCHPSPGTDWPTLCQIWSASVSTLVSCVLLCLRPWWPFKWPIQTSTPAPIPFPHPPLQVSALAGQLHSPLLDPGVDLLRGHVCQGHCAGEGGSSEGDSQDDGPAGRHLLAELVHYQPHTTRHQFYASRPHPQGDHIAALNQFSDSCHQSMLLMYIVYISDLKDSLNHLSDSYNNQFISLHIIIHSLMHIMNQRMNWIIGVNHFTDSQW